MCRALGALAVDTDCGTMAVGPPTAVKRFVKLGGSAFGAFGCTFGFGRIPSKSAGRRCF